MSTNTEAAQALISELFPDGISFGRRRKLELTALRVIEAAERHGLQRAVQIVQDVADEHVNQDTDAFRELCIVIADLKALAEE